MFNTRGCIILLGLYIITSSGFIFNIRTSPKQSRNRCELRLLKMTIHPPRKYSYRCQSASVLTFGCRGGCESYSKIDKHNASNIQRYCSCCRQTREKLLPYPVTLPCYDGSRLRIPVKTAVTCHCRPCSMSVDQMDIFSLRNLLESSRPTSAFFGG